MTALQDNTDVLELDPSAQDLPSGCVPPDWPPVR